MVTRFSATNHPTICERMAKDCLILASSGVDLATISKLAETAVARGQGHTYFLYSEFGKGLADYRNGRFTDAADLMGKVLDAAGNISFRDVQANLVLAMAQWQLSHAEEARVAVAKGA
jgi:hypothetical protein